ncbi:MAG TPA: hypothetical protein VFZ09_25115 [Archangium sp.]|uniref:hypothetical protein n=1 Tax=Archangium sp. TaxID=1872627 RepID=UPI002E3401F0|nr:hypothetical protein [Archangium sp.]HEX5749534.1 hypothetical protein [Archangium sp.]
MPRREGGRADGALIGQLRVRSSACEPLSARLRLEGLLGCLDFFPGGLPPSAIVCIQKLEDPRPRTLRLHRYELRPPAEWERAFRESLRARISRAARPARGVVPEGAGAVVFADPAELYACLANDVGSGVATSRWWWTGRFLGADPYRALLTEWNRAPEYVPASLELLARWGRAEAFLRRMGEREARELLAGVNRRFGLGALERALAEQRTHAVEPGEEAPPWASWLPEADAAALGLEPRTLLGVALMIRRAPGVVDLPRTATAVARWRERMRQRGAAVPSGGRAGPALRGNPLPVHALEPGHDHTGDLPGADSSNWSDGRTSWNSSRPDGSPDPTGAAPSQHLPDTLVMETKTHAPADATSAHPPRAATREARAHAPAGTPPRLPTTTAAEADTRTGAENITRSRAPAAPIKTVPLASADTPSARPPHAATHEAEALAPARTPRAWHPPSGTAPKTDTHAEVAGITLAPEGTAHSQHSPTGTAPKTDTHAVPSDIDHARHDHTAASFDAVPHAATDAPAARPPHAAPHETDALASEGTAHARPPPTGTAPETDIHTPAEAWVAASSHTRAPSPSPTEEPRAEHPSSTPIGEQPARLPLPTSLAAGSAAPPGTGEPTSAAGARIPAPPLPEPFSWTGEPIHTRLGGTFYLLNLALALELYGDFTQPAFPGLRLPVWDFLTLLGDELLAKPSPEDPLWTLLARLAGRPPGTPAGDGFEPPSEWRLSPAWLKAFREPGTWHWSTVRQSSVERLHVRHPAGFLVLDVARTQEEPEAQLHRETGPHAGSTPFSLAPETRAPGEAEPSPLERWLGWLVPYVRARLARALGTEGPEELSRVLLEHEARVHVTESHVDVVFPLASLPLPVRFAGLDRDIGWIPAAGRHVLFHFD